MKKRLLSMVLAMAMVMSMITIQASAATVVSTETHSDGLTWTLTSDGTLTISGQGEMTDTWDWPYNQDDPLIDPVEDILYSVSKIVIKNGVTSICCCAFSCMGNLESITIPSSVTSIGGAAFELCYSLKSITIPSSVTSIEDLAFWGSGLTSITLPKGLTVLSCGVFEHCSSLTSVTIPDSVTIIEDYAFYGSGVKSVVIGTGVTEIWEGAFNDCSNLTTISFAGSAPEFDEEIFGGVKATAYYPANDSSWTATVMQDYGGDITWVANESNFCDVLPTQYYYDSVVWAAANSITAGTSSTTFSPTRACTRAEAVTFLYRYAGSPSVSSTSKFTDVKSSAYYASAVAWAVENGITAGTSSTKFSPTTTCNRAMIVTFLYRYNSTL